MTILIIALISAVILLGITVIVTLRALGYIQQHPELITNGAPLAYQRCQQTLTQVIERFKTLQQQGGGSLLFAWQSPGGRVFTVSDKGVEQRTESSGINPIILLRWSDIGGVGVRMQPGFRLVDVNRDGHTDGQHTTGYSFHLLIVPFSGSTMNIYIPTNDRSDAVEFVAHTLVMAERMDKRINVFGFDRPPAPTWQRVSRI